MVSLSALIWAAPAQVILVSTFAVAAALPLYYYRHRIVTWFHGRNAARTNGANGANGGLDRDKPGP